MVQVLMSTYNGEKYIKEQLDSILSQTYRDIRILIRDDSSVDGTVAILKEYSERYQNVEFYVGDNLGAQGSFFDLFAHVDQQAKYIATSDQDDVWYTDKIETAVSCLQGLNVPGLYCCKTQLTDKDLNPLKDRLRKQTPAIHFGNALIENICTGCTMVINKALYNLVQGKWPRQSVIHDWWFYQVALCFGKVIYDDTSHVFYRQHGNNVIGLDSGRLELIKRQLKSFLKFKGKYTAQVEEFINTFPLSGEHKYLAELMAGTKNSWICRFKILFEERIHRQGGFDTFLFKIMLALGWL